MREDHLYILEAIKSRIASHGLKSGEVIVVCDDLHNQKGDIKEIVVTFLRDNSINTKPSVFEIIEISKDEALKSIKYGLSTKPNYTAIEQEFSTSDQNELTFSFLQLFDKPKFYSLDSRIYKTDLDKTDFWESGGAIAIDKERIGIFWTNELYDKF